MDNKREKIIERIKKLLAVADNRGATEHEAAAAALAAQRHIAEYDVEKYPAAVIGAAIAKIAENVPEIRFKKSHGVRKWFIPPAIQNTDRFRNAE